MPRRAAGLTAALVSKRTEPGRFGDGAGLYLLVRSADAKFWIFRYTRAGRMREMGLGPAVGRAAVKLADARREARRLHDMVRAGLDPLDEREAARATARLEAAKAVTFRDCAAAYIAAHAPGWHSRKHAAQWGNTLATYVDPVVGGLPVQAIDTTLVLKCLEPLWTAKPETAGRVRGRIEAILDWAKVRGYRNGGENPARWRGHLDKLLPKKAKLRAVEHMPAMAHVDLPAFIGDLRKQVGTAARALELTILCAMRTGEVTGARWAEFDAVEKVLTIPGQRMKAGRAHRVALADRAIEIIEAQRGADPVFIFPGARPSQPLSNAAMLALLRRMGLRDVSVHGFRSTFAVWARERTGFPRELVEATLAHIIADRTEAAYVRTDLLDKRRTLMQAWARYCTSPAAKQAKVVAMGAKP